MFRAVCRRFTVLRERCLLFEVLCKFVHDRNMCLILVGSSESETGECAGVHELVSTLLYVLC